MDARGHIVNTEPRCLTLRDAIATPFELVAPSQVPDLPPRDSSFKAYTRGCLYEADGARVDLSVRAGGVGGDEAMSIDAEILPPEQRGGSWLAGRTLYLGTFMNHYGRFVTEGLSRFWPQELGAFDHVVAYPFIHNDGATLVQESHRYLAGLLNVPIERMAALRSQTVFDEIVMPEQLWACNSHVNVHMREVYGRISARHAGKGSAGRIFLSRVSSPRLGNVAAVEEIFASFGFRVLYPEQIKIADQLSLYANCEILAGLSGSAMHNCLFARLGLMTIEVGDARARRKPVLMQRIANELAQVDARFIPFGEREDVRIEPKIVKKHLRDILGELPRTGPALLLRLKRRWARLKSGKKTRQNSNA
ncbi:MAG TPA: glycosyltransferase family 61 protein [Dongiaceae bacterium]|nr:glycosyltransferase family 61 protein [Dongiaceae bacterium]